MNPTSQNTINIINSNISHAVLRITQSGKDTISKKTALKLQDLLNSEEIKALPENDRLDVLDRVSDLVKELQEPTTDTGKVHGGLKTLGGFISSKASKTMTQFVAQAAITYAIANGLKF
jgi:hypothetical protein